MFLPVDVREAPSKINSNKGRIFDYHMRCSIKNLYFVCHSSKSETAKLVDTNI